ncbi:HNH endonuclease [Candidatus Lokiarchaeum ossiferum]
MYRLTYRDKNGYKRYCNSGKLVHRHVAECKLGRKLRRGEVVHHKNRNKMDNSRSNLWVCKSQTQHEYYHKKDKRNTGRW